MSSHRPRRLRKSLGLLVLWAVLLTACGGGGDGGSDDAAPKPGPNEEGAEERSDVDPEGVARTNLDLTAQYHFDPVKTQAAGLDLPRQALIYGQLLRPTPDGSFEPDLATKATVVDPQLIEIELRENVTFSDGTPFDAEAVKFSIERNKATDGPQFSPELKEISDIEVIDPHNLRIRFRTPVAGAFYPSLAGLDTIIVSPTAAQAPGADLDKNSVGAGPFKLVSFEPGKRLVLEKSSSYWDADNIDLGGIEYTHLAPGPQVINALGSHQLDMAIVALDQVGTAERFGYEVTTFTPPTSLIYAPVCKTTKPFDDVRVRQALNYAIDREALNDVVYQGLGEPAWGLLPDDHALFPKNLKGYYEHDPRKAKKLLAEAGFADGISFEVLLLNDPVSARLGEVIKEQWAKAGIRADFRQSPNFVQEFYTDKSAPLLFVPAAQPGIRHFLQWNGEALGNACQYKDPKVAEMVDQLRALSPEDPRGKALWAEAQTYVVENALSIWGVFAPSTAAFDPDRLGGVEYINYPVAGQPTADLHSLYVKK